MVGWCSMGTFNDPWNPWWVSQQEPATASQLLPPQATNFYMGPIHPRDKKPVGALDPLDGITRIIAMKKYHEFYIDIVL